MHLRIAAFVASLVSFVSPHLHAQSGEHPVGIRYELPIGFLASQNLEQPSVRAWGASLGLGVGVQHWPLTLGVDVRPLLWREQTRSVVLEIDGTPIAAELTRRDQTIGFDTWLRFHPAFAGIRPFVEGTVGLRLVDLEYSLTVQGADAPITTHDSSHYPTWGLGAGLDVLVTKTRAAAVYATASVRCTAPTASPTEPLPPIPTAASLAGSTMLAVFIGLTMSLSSP